MKMSITVDSKKVIDKLNKSSRQLKSEIDVAMAESGILLKEEIEYSIEGNRSEPRSVDTGAFLASINVDQNNSSKSSYVNVYSEVDYSSFLEFGTSKMEARSHFRNSLNRLKFVIKDKFKYVLSKIS
jgi:HK97 gp10 family phage protein